MYSAEDFIKIPQENWVREDSDQGRFGHFFTDRGEQHPNLVVMENPAAPKFSRPIRLGDSFT